MLIPMVAVYTALMLDTVGPVQEVQLIAIQLNFLAIEPDLVKNFFVESVAIVTNLKSAQNLENNVSNARVNIILNLCASLKGGK